MLYVGSAPFHTIIDPNDPGFRCERAERHWEPLPAALAGAVAISGPTFGTYLCGAGPVVRKYRVSYEGWPLAKRISNRSATFNEIHKNSTRLNSSQ